MTKHRGHDYLEAALADLERRISRLETRAEAVAEAIRLLAHALEESPVAEPSDRAVADAARRAYELLIVTGPVSPQRR